MKKLAATSQQNGNENKWLMADLKYSQHDQGCIIQERTELESEISEQTTDIEVVKNELTCVHSEAPLEHDGAFYSIKGYSCLFISIHQI